MAKAVTRKGKTRLKTGKESQRDFLKSLKAYQRKISKTLSKARR